MIRFFGRDPQTYARREETREAETQEKKKMKTGVGVSARGRALDRLT